jgi:hypothetical protein
MHEGGGVRKRKMVHEHYIALVSSQDCRELPGGLVWGCRGGHGEDMYLVERALLLLNCGGSRCDECVKRGKRRMNKGKTLTRA